MGISTSRPNPGPVWAARAPGRVGSPLPCSVYAQLPLDVDARADLALLLRDPDPAVRRDAAFALGQLPEGGHAPALLGALREESDPEVRVQLLEALGKTGDGIALDTVM